MSTNPNPLELLIWDLQTGSYRPGSEDAYMLLILLLVLGIIPYALGRKTAKLSVLGSFLLLIVCFGAAVGVQYTAVSMQLVRGLSAGLALYLGVPFLFMLYRKWTGRARSEKEAQGGKEGIKAWLRWPNLVWVVSIAVTADLGLGWSPWGVGALCIALLVAYPLAQEEGEDASLETSPVTPEERMRVLRMLEEGKINAEECAELLQALSDASVSSERASIGAPWRSNLVYVGFALVVAGFFLPWFTITFGGVMRGAPGNSPYAAIHGLQNSSAPLLNTSQFAQISSDISRRTRAVSRFSFAQREALYVVRGGEIQNGIGWAILLISGFAAWLPVAWKQGGPNTMKTLSLVLLGIGIFLLIYVGSSAWRLVGLGFVLTVVGYAFQFLAILKPHLLRIREPVRKEALANGVT